MRLRKFVSLVKVLGLGLALVLLAWPGTVLAVDILVNGAFESFQSYNGKDWRGFPEKTGQGWTVKVLAEDGLHFMDSETFGHFAAAVYGVADNNYRLEGNYSQVFASRHGFNFVFSQTVAVAAGQDYALGGKIVSFWKGPGGEWDDTKIFKRIGLDPSGGVSYDGPNVVWTDWDGLDNTWTSPALATTAQAGQMTVFIQVNNTGGDVGAAYLNSGHIDNFKFELAPVAILNLPGQAAPGNVNVTWSVTVPDTGVWWELWGYDVEYKNGATGTWQVIQTHDSANGRNAGYTLTAQAGKTYTFRVRPWQQKKYGGDPTVTALPGVWKEKSVAIGQAVVGRVIDHAGLGLSGVTVSISGALTSTVSGADGAYQLPTGADGTFYIRANDFNGLVAPPPAAATTSQTVPGQLTIMLRPTGANQGLVDNDFETDLSNWNPSGPAGVSTTESHTGNASLLLGNGATASQSGNVAAMRQPLLSFWYKSQADTTLNVEFLDAGSPVQTKALTTANDWTHVTLESGLGESYSGSVGANFTQSGSGSVFIDEVSIAAGPYKTYLPITLK
ncbi:MAG: hypothetical protein AB1801_22310, partial [Chloroflexota bacterium]